MTGTVPASAATPRRWGLLAVLMLLVSGCTALDAPGQGTVSVVCSNDAAVCRAWAEGYTRRTGHSVTMERLPTSEALERIRRSDGTPEYDVWHGGGSETYVVAAREGLLAPYASPSAGGVPAELRDPEHRWTGVYSSVLALCVHPEALAAIGAATPTTWDDLLDPELTGQISASSPRTSGTAFTTMALQVDRLGAARGMDYLEDLYGQVFQFTRSGTAPARVVAQGEAAVAITFAPYCESAKESGHPVELVHPRDGTGYEVGAVAVLSDAPHPDLAREYVDQAVSVEGQRDGVASGIEQIPTHAALPGNLTAVLRADTYPMIPSSLASRADRRASLLEWFTQEAER